MPNIVSFCKTFLIGHGINLLTQPFVARHALSEKGWGKVPEKVHAIRKIHAIALYSRYFLLPYM